MDSCEFQTAVDNMMEDLVTSLYAVIDDLVIKLRDCFTDLEFQEIDANKMNNNKTKDFLKILKTKSRGTHMRLLDAMESFGCIEIACKLREICERAPGNLSLTEGTADVHVKSIGAVPPSSKGYIVTYVARLDTIRTLSIGFECNNKDIIILSWHDKLAFLSFS